MNKVIVNRNGAFVATDDKELLKIKQTSDTYFINHKTYLLMHILIGCFDKSHLKEIKQVRDGKAAYWEENYHDKIVNFVVMMNPKLTRSDVSNCLCAMEL